MKIYEGRRGPDGCIVTVNSDPLPLRLDLANHSPTGFAWGYLGSGPSQLALAIMADHFGPGGEKAARDTYQSFKAEVIAHLPHEGWTLRTDEIDAWIAWWAAATGKESA